MSRSFRRSSPFIRPQSATNTQVVERVSGRMGMGFLRTQRPLPKRYELSLRSASSDPTLVDWTRSSDPNTETIMGSFVPRRTSKLKILSRLSIVPIGVTLFWTFMLSLGSNYNIVRAALIGGFGATALVLGFLWGFTNVMTALTMPKVWLLLRRGGGDPWFMSIPPPFNNDPPEVRYQELYGEKFRQENEWLQQPLVPLPPQNDPKDATRGIDDPNII